MNDVSLLAGSLSNDLFRVVNLQQRGSEAAAKRFLLEAKRWAEPLANQTKKKYIQDIANDVNTAGTQQISEEIMEKYLMFGVLLQNFALHNQ